MRYYSPTIRQRVKAGPNTLGIQLARHAIRMDLSIKEVSHLVGASRMTVYNWYNGRAVTNAYQPRVKQLIEILKTAPSSDAAWSTACQIMNTPT